MNWHRKKIVTIVEGHGEVTAVPALVDRWIRLTGTFAEFTVRATAIRAAGCGALKCAHSSADDLGVEHYVQIAMMDKPYAILIVVDADEECGQSELRSAGLGPRLLERASGAANGSLVSVVVAEREYEAWFLEHADTLRMSGARLCGNVPDHRPPNEIRDCKGAVGRLLQRGYVESFDQLELTKYLPLTPNTDLVSRSYEKLLKELGRLIPPHEVDE